MAVKLQGKAAAGLLLLHQAGLMWSFVLHAMPIRCRPPLGWLPTCSQALAWAMNRGALADALLTPAQFVATYMAPLTPRHGAGE